MSGAGNFVFSGSNTYGGATTVNASSLTLDFTALPTATNVVNPLSVLTLNRAALTIKGQSGAATSQTFTALTISGSASTINVNANGSTGVTVNLGPITRVGNPTLDLPGASATFTTSSALVNGIVGGYATVNGTDWLANSSNAPPTYAVDEYVTSGTNANVDVQVGGTPDGSTANSLRFNTPTAAPLALPGAFVVNTGGILVTPNVSTGTLGITGGSLTSSGGTANNPGNNVVVDQFDTTTPFTIASAITNNGATAIGLTKAGPGVLIVTGGNTFTGPTAVFAGTLQGSVASLPTNIGVAAGANVTFNENGPTPVVWAKSLTGGGSFTKAGSNTLTISGSNFAYTGATAVNGGVLVWGSTATLATSTVNVGPGGTFNPQGTRNLARCRSRSPGPWTWSAEEEEA